MKYVNIISLDSVSTWFPTDSDTKCVVSRQGIRLPVEILHIILSFYTNDYHGLIKFSTICKEWKEVSDYSSIWLQCELFFYSTNQYFKALNYPYSVPNESLTELKKLKGDNDPRVFNLHDPHTKYPSRIHKICFRKYIPKSHLLPQEDAYEIRNKFMIIFLEYHKLWEKISYKINISRKYKTFFIDYRSYYLSFYFILVPILQSIASYLFLDISIDSRGNSSHSNNNHNPPPPNDNNNNSSNTSEGLTIANHFGFVCEYIFFIVIFIYVLVALPLYYHDGICFRTGDMKKIFTWPLIAVCCSCLTFLLGVILTLVLFHIALATSLLPYSCIAIPLWVGVITSISLILSIPDRSTDWTSYFVLVIFGGLVLCEIPLGLTLLGLYYDRSDHYPIHSIQNVIICWYPILFALVALFVYSLGQNFERVKQMMRGEFTCRKIFYGMIKVLIGFMRSLLIGGIIGIFVFLNFQMTKENDFPLSTGLICFLWILFCIVYSCYFDFFNSSIDRYLTT